MFKKSFFVFILFSLISFALFGKTVRVGYFKESGTLMSGMSEEDPKNGFAYEYLQNIASYTGWTYEYKYGYFTELYDALLNDEIDLLVDISYTPERSKQMRFSEYPMATESYYLYSNSYNPDISSENFSTLNGKSIALAQGTYQYDLFMNWLNHHDINLDINLIPYSEVTEEDFNSGKYDLYLSIDLVSDFDWEPVAKIGSSEIYAVVNNNHPDILEDLNKAQNSIYLSDPFYNNKLWSKYFSNPSLPKRLSPREHYWMYQHQILSIGCLKQEKAHAYIDSKTGEAKGLIPYLMNRLKEHFELPNQKFIYHFYNNIDEIDEALLNGEIDVAFPAIYDLEAAEKRNQILSKSVLSSSLSIVYSSKDINLFEASRGLMVVAIPRDCRTGEMLIRKGVFEGVVYEYFDTHESCIEAVRSKNADVAVFHENNVNRLLQKNRRYRKLYATDFYDTVDYSFVTKRENYNFISVMNKLISIIPASEINRVVLTESIIIDELNLKKFLKEYHPTILLVVFLVALLLFGFFVSLGHVQLLINYDVLTHLLNRRTLSNYMKSALSKAKSQGEVFSIMIFDLDDFKAINDNYGHAFGDEVLKMAAETISKGIKRNDYAFRWGGEEFLVLLKADRNVAYKVAERIRVEIELQDVFYYSDKINVTTTVGIASYQEDLSEKELFAIADKNLYKGKKNGKNQVVAE